MSSNLTVSATQTGPRMRSLALVPAAIFVVACTTLAVPTFDSRFGPADPTRFDHPAEPLAGQSYARDVQPILDRRCVVCHACYDAPCQLKTTSWEGLVRGASKTPVFDATRLTAAEPSRLYVDAQMASQWRQRGFFPVINEHASTPDANRTAGLMYQLLALKHEHPMVAGDPAVPASPDVSPGRANTCPAEDEIGAYEQRAPLAGMPFGLPGLDAAEYGELTRWLEQGARYEGPSPLPAATAQRVAEWERFFNGDALKAQLFSRYAYEHLFLAHLYFDDLPERTYFKLVRSTTPPGQAVKLIATRRPVDDPGVARVYYRLVADRETIVAKTHMPYLLNAARMARWRELFFDPPYAVDRLPGYDDATAANPFLTFASLPVQARYRFMLDEAAFTIMGFIKGPVCRGQMAVDVIEDRFWVTFLAPSDELDNAAARLLQRDANLLRLPTGSSNTGILIPWLHYARLENEYLRAKTAVVAGLVGRRAPLDLGLIWNGDGRNDNAALTIFRHFDSASVVKGMVGEPPKSAWVIGYPLLERIHYLLVADFDVYGNIGHQLNTRLYMDFMRMEGEFNFLALLPKSQRIVTRDFWYRGTGEAAREQVYGGPGTTLEVESNIVYRSGDAKNELLALMKARLAPVLNTSFDLGTVPDPALRAQLQALQGTDAASLRWLPEVAVLGVATAEGATATFTLLRNTGHASVSHLAEGSELRPEEDTLTVVPGVIGAYPNAFYRARAAELPAFVDALRRLRSGDDYSKFVRRWAVRRNDATFWAFSDGVHGRYVRDQTPDAGVLDFNRLENR